MKYKLLQAARSIFIPQKVVCPFYFQIDHPQPPISWKMHKTGTVSKLGFFTLNFIEPFFFLVSDDKKQSRIESLFVLLVAGENFGGH